MFCQRARIILAGTPPTEAFKRLYYSHRASPLPKILSLQRVKLLARLEQIPESLEGLARETGIPGDTLYGYWKGYLRLAIVKRSREGKAYRYSFQLHPLIGAQGFRTVDNFARIF